MVIDVAEEWLTISLKDPYLFVGVPQSSRAQCLIEGSITVTVSKTTKVRWLHLHLAGLVRSAFSFDSSGIPAAKPCEPCDKFSYGCRVLDYQEHPLSNGTKEPHTLSAGTHTFPFAIQIPEDLPPTLSSGVINVSYQLTASVQLASFIPFSHLYQVTKPIILLPHEVTPNDTFYRSGLLPLISKHSGRLAGRITSPCLVFPQAGTIQMMIYLSLQGNETFVLKVSVELWESVFQIDAAPNQDPALKSHLEERLISRQSCPIVDWPSSVRDGDPTIITKRLLFRVPKVPLSHWSDGEISIDDRRRSLPKGFCHSSGKHPQVGIEIKHTLRVVVNLEGRLLDAITSNGKEIDTAEQEAEVWVSGLHQQDSQVDETHPPSYYRSFTSILVEGVRLAEIDRRSFEALQYLVQDDLPSLLPGYEESISSTSSSFRTRIGGAALTDSGYDSLDTLSVEDSSTSSRQSTDMYAYDLAAYAQQYSCGDM